VRVVSEVRREKRSEVRVKREGFVGLDRGEEFG